MHSISVYIKGKGKAKKMMIAIARENHEKKSEPAPSCTWQKIWKMKDTRTQSNEMEKKCYKSQVMNGSWWLLPDFHVTNLKLCLTKPGKKCTHQESRTKDHLPSDKELKWMIEEELCAWKEKMWYKQKWKTQWKKYTLLATKNEFLIQQARYNNPLAEEEYLDPLFELSMMMSEDEI